MIVQSCNYACRTADITLSHRYYSHTSEVNVHRGRLHVCWFFAGLYIRSGGKVQHQRITKQWSLNCRQKRIIYNILPVISDWWEIMAAKTDRKFWKWPFINREIQEAQLLQRYRATLYVTWNQEYIRNWNLKIVPMSRADTSSTLTLSLSCTVYYEI